MSVTANESSDALETRDLMEQDMARHEARFKGEVHGSRNQALAAEALEQFERQSRDAAPAPAPADPQPDVLGKRDVDGKMYELQRDADRDTYRTATDFEANVLRHAMPRMQLLMSKTESGPLGSPSWNQRALAAFYFKIKSIEAMQSGKPAEADVFERAFQQDLYDLLEASNAVFGDWRKPAPEKLIIGG